MTAKNLKVLIVGGGAGGMSASIALSRIGVQVELIDINAKWGMLGAGLTITGPTLRAFKALGVLDDIKKNGYTGSGIQIRDYATAEPIRLLETPVVEEGVPTSGGIMRPQLHEALYKHMVAAKVPVRTGVTFESLTQDADGVDVVFSDGTQGRYDLVLGADGVNSKVRSTIFPDAPKAEYTGQNVWRVTVKRPPTVERRTFFLGGPLKVGFTPISDTEMYMFVLETAPKMFREETNLHIPLKELLKDYGGDVAKVRDALTADDKIVFRPLEAFVLPAPWYRGRVLLIGDSAHPTTPQLASGAGMAVEDALVLEDLLKKSTDIPLVLADFMARRIERCRMIVEGSMEIGRLEQARAPVAEQTAVVQRVLAALTEPV
jgi:2-polyprenyl-6-methoxyphenol hydroxylase-like FAD-dependent oxidoreductase